LTTTYKVVFRPRAKKQFDKLDTANQRQLVKKLEERRRNPRVPGDALSHMPNCYKIKLRARGIRLIYQVRDNVVLLLVLAIGGRENEDAYIDAARELAKLDD
jgi:mRNA interferase RelE/StbE